MPEATLANIADGTRVSISVGTMWHPAEHLEAALGAAFKLRSPNTLLNEVVRELSLDLAEGGYDVEFAINSQATPTSWPTSSSG